MVNGSKGASVKKWELVVVMVIRIFVSSRSITRNQHI